MRRRGEVDGKDGSGLRVMAFEIHGVSAALSVLAHHQRFLVRRHEFRPLRDVEVCEVLDKITTIFYGYHILTNAEHQS